MSTVGPFSTPLALLPHAQAGDEQAMNYLLTAITPYVARLCRSVTHDDGADATQEALLAIYRGLPSLREAAAFYGWVRAVTVREALRTVKRTGVAEVCAPADLGQQSNPMDTVYISDLLERLSTTHRQVLTLRSYGLTEEEMANVLSLPVGTVRSRLHRARCRFREAWLSSAAA